MTVVNSRLGRTKIRCAALAETGFTAGIAMSVALSAHAQYPERADRVERVVRAIVPFSTGGTNDITARLIAPHLGKLLGQQVVVENRPGAAGNVGIEAVAKSAPDGHTLLFSATASTQNPALFRNLRFPHVRPAAMGIFVVQLPLQSTLTRSWSTHICR